MTVRTPTSLVIDFNTDLKTEIANNKFTSHRLITNKLQLPVGSYSMGSIDLSEADNEVFLGHAGVGVILSDNRINVTLGQSSPVNTKFFAYDGVKMPISVSSNSLTPITVEYVIGDKVPVMSSAPTITNAVADDGTALVSFSEPVDTGDSAIISYTVTSHPGNITATGPASPIEVDGLTNGTPYTFTIVATNSSGDSVASQASGEVTPIGVPLAPTITGLTSSGRSVVVTVTPPANNGGSPITSYIAFSHPSTISGESTTTSITVNNLVYGTEYDFTVIAVNNVGPSLHSEPSDPITLTTTSSAPTITNVVAGDTQATITFTPPTSTGGLPIDFYKVIYNPGDSYTTGTSSPIIATELTNGTPYTFTIVAVNDVGEGVPSAASNSVIPSTVPDAPTIDDVVAGDAQATITFTEPLNDGGNAITGFTVTSNPDNISDVGVSSPITVTGLTNGTEYTFTVVATNVNGDSVDSAASTGVTPAAPATVPDAPIMISAVGGDTDATVTFTPPDFNGGAPISVFQVTSNPGNIVATGYNSPILVSTLTNETAYTFTVTAVNSVGTSAPSASSNSVTPTTA